MLYSEFRDGNVPAGHEQLRVLKESLRHLPDSVKKVSLRSDTAGYQEDLLRYCGEGKDPRFGVIAFAIGADVTEAFRAAVLATPQDAWQPLIRWVDDKPQQTDQEWAEICYVPSWAGHSRKRADYRFLAIREPLRQLALGDEAQLLFPTQGFGQKGVYKLFGDLKADLAEAVRSAREERQEPLRARSAEAERSAHQPTLTLEAIERDPWNAVELPLPANADAVAGLPAGPARRASRTRTNTTRRGGFKPTSALN
jgi:hypothetical protein